jgi:hypothetical protein
MATKLWCEQETLPGGETILARFYGNTGRVVILAERGRADTDVHEFFTGTAELPDTPDWPQYEGLDFYRGFPIGSGEYQKRLIEALRSFQARIAELTG